MLVSFYHHGENRGRVQVVNEKIDKFTAHDKHEPNTEKI